MNVLLLPSIKIPLSDAFLTVKFESVLPLPEIVIPRPELPLVDEKSIVALFLPEIFTPLLSLTAPLLTVPSITIVVPLEALLIADDSDVPPFLTVIVLPLVLPELFEPDPELKLDGAEHDSNTNCWHARPLYSQVEILPPASFDHP